MIETTPEGLYEFLNKEYNLLMNCQIGDGQGESGLDWPPLANDTGALTGARMLTTPQNFEWIPHDDAGARKRARAHVTRVFRRQKVTEAQLQKKKKGNNRGSANDTIKLQTSDQNVVSNSAKPALETEHYEGVNDVTHANEMIVKPVLQRTIGSVKRDPFASLPVQLSPDSRALLDHCEP